MSYIRALFLILPMISSSMLAAQDFYWAGVGFLGDYSKRSVLYPYSANVFDRKDCQGTSCFEAYSRSVFKNKSIAGGRVVLGHAEPGNNAVGVALGIAYERIIIEKTPKNNATDKNIINTIAIFGNLMFMNLDSNKLIGSVPTYLTYTEASATDLANGDLQLIVQKLLTSNSLNISFAKNALKRAKKYTLPGNRVIRSQITSVTISDLAANGLNYSPDEITNLNLAMAHIFEASLMKEAKLQMLPSRVGHIVGGKLKTRLSSGDRTILLPDADIKFRVELAKVGRFSSMKDGGRAQTVCHGSRIKFVVDDSFDDRVFARSLRSLPCRIYRIGSEINDSIVYEKSIFGLLSNTAKAINKPNDSRKFYKKASPDDKRGTEKSFRKLHKLATS